MNESEILIDDLCAVFNCGDPDFIEDSNAEPQYFYSIDDNNSLSITGEKLRGLRNELNGLILNVTFMDDYPLSYLVNRTGRVGKGVAFEILDFLAEKLNFTYDLIKPQRNIMGSTDQYDGSIFELLDREVS